MCVYCDGIWEQRKIRLNDNLSPMDGGALFFDTDVRDSEDVYLYREVTSRFSWASLATADELGDGEESCLDIVFTVNDDDDDDDSGATFVSVGFLVYFCPWCGRDLRPARVEGVSASAIEVM